MNINFEAKKAEVISGIKQEGYSAKTLAEHRRCYDELWKYLSAANTTFSTETALDWLESRKSSWSFDTYKRYRRAMYRFVEYVDCGKIGIDHYYGNHYFAYHDSDISYIKLPDDYKLLYREFYEAVSIGHAKGTIEHYSVGVSDFLLYISEQGCDAPYKMTVELPLGYLRRIHKTVRSDETKKKYGEGVGQLLTYLSGQGHIPYCYSHIMSKLGDETDITSLKLKGKYCMGAAFQPSKSLELRANSFLSNLDERRYSEPPQNLFGFIFTNFFLFIEINHITYSANAVRLWLNHIPKTTSWILKRQIITWFADYMETGSAKRNSNYVWKPLLIDTLPEWSRKIFENYLTLRKKEGWEPSTLMMIRSSCVRFFRFIDANGIDNPGAITPMIVKEFHNTDTHTTPEAGNAYGVRVRRLLKYMAEESLVPQNLYLAISTQCSQRQKIVAVMSEDMISAVYRYRENATNPKELRDAAMVMIGLRMGIRSSDIVNLKIGDFDFRNRTVSFVQTKTGKAITLTIPTDVGNSVYKYITNGRPRSGESGVGFIFVRHNSPYSNLNRRNCGHALARILSAGGLKLPHGQGFHITRRTFATRLLRARTKIDSIADALGHASRQAVDDYLAHDEEGMLLCPLSFTIGGARNEIHF